MFLQFGKILSLLRGSSPISSNFLCQRWCGAGCTEQYLSFPYEVSRWARLSQSCLSVLEEEEITFAPTYRFERGTREKYAYTKQKATGVGENWFLSERKSYRRKGPNPISAFSAFVVFWNQSIQTKKDFTQIYGGWAREFPVLLWTGPFPPSWQSLFLWFADEVQFAILVRSSALEIIPHGARCVSVLWWVDNRL